MKKTEVVGVERAALLSALDYLQYLDSRMDTIETACSEMCHQISRLQHWLERISRNDKIDK